MTTPLPHRSQTAPPAPALRALETRLADEDLPRGFTQRPAGPGLVRVHRPCGEIAGHIRIVPGHAGTRFRAEVWRQASGRFFVFGEFWAARDAVDALPRR